MFTGDRYDLSDVFTQLVTPRQAIFTGLWVMNNSILKDNVYQTMFSEFWENWKFQKGNFINLSMWWDIGKKRIKSLTIDYCKEKRRTERTYICSQDNFNCFYCTVLYAQILLVGNGRDMHLLVTMTYDLSDVYASDWSARRYDLTGDCDSPDTFTDCHGLHRPDYTLDQVNTNLGWVLV